MNDTNKDRGIDGFEKELAEAESLFRLNDEDGGSGGTGAPPENAQPQPPAELSGSPEPRGEEKRVPETADTIRDAREPVRPGRCAQCGKKKQSEGDLCETCERLFGDSQMPARDEVTYSDKPQPLERESLAEDPCAEEHTKIDPVTEKTPIHDLQIYRGGKIIAVRYNGKNYTSEDEDVPGTVKAIILRVSKGESIAEIINEYRFNKPGSSGGGGSPSVLFRMMRVARILAANPLAVILYMLALIFIFQLVSVIKGCG